MADGTDWARWTFLALALGCSADVLLALTRG